MALFARFALFILILSFNINWSTEQTQYSSPWSYFGYWSLAKLEVAVELCNLLLALASHLWDEEEGGDGEKEAGEGVEEEDVDAAHRVEHGLEEEGDQEPDEGADKDRQRDDLVSDLRGK